MKIEHLNDLFLHTLQDVYYAELHVAKALPKMADASDSPELARIFADRLAKTNDQIARVERAFDQLKQKPKDRRCGGIEGLLEEAKELKHHIKDPDTRDAAMIAAAQTIEHYEIARYGTLVSWANLLGLHDVAKTLGQNLKSDHAADAKLTSVAEARLNKQAVA